MATGRRRSVSLRFVSMTEAFLRVHQWLYVRSDGRVGQGMIGVPTLRPQPECSSIGRLGWVIS